jgi:fermentation-respiration switch protein FrsA (DUF1100 family)
VAAPDPPPADWNAARISGGATLTYPPGWRPLRTDPGTATVGLLQGDDLVGYLNATPLQGTETLANWAASGLITTATKGIAMWI